MNVYRNVLKTPVVTNSRTALAANVLKARGDLAALRVQVSTVSAAASSMLKTKLTSRVAS